VQCSAALGYERLLEIPSIARLAGADGHVLRLDRLSVASVPSGTSHVSYANLTENIHGNKPDRQIWKTGY